MDTGGLSQMSFNQFSSTGLGLPGAGYASRGKNSRVTRLSVAAVPDMNIPPISEHGGEAVQTPRTSRSHLLAGLRTQPKAQGVPASAPYNQTQHRFGLDTSKHAAQPHAAVYSNYRAHVPHTAIGSGFPNTAQQYSLRAAEQVYSLPEQVLAPPEIDYAALQGDEQADPSLTQQLMATEYYLAQRQAQLQQQLQQQLYNFNLQGAGQTQSNALHTSAAGFQTPQTPMTPHNSVYYQQLQKGVSPVVQEIQGHPGVFLVYNPLTGQQSIFDSQAQQVHLASSPAPITPGHYAGNSFSTERSGSIASPLDAARSGNPFDVRSISPPKKTPSPPMNIDVAPLPPPSANAFRRSHSRTLSKNVAALALNNNAAVTEGPKSAIVRPVGFPATPMTGTFGPGNARAGEHPTRQPRGPPDMEELVAAPTSKHEGSKNFVTRQRRGAVRSLVKAGIERRGVGRQNSLDSNPGSLSTPVSETEVVFSVPSDGEDSIGNGSLSGKPSFGSLRAVQNGAIGSEMKLRKSSASSNSSEAGSQRVRSPMSMLPSAVMKRVGGF